MNEPDYILGRRILVRGVTGSGKSTLARALGDALGLPVIELDAIHWQRPNWQPLPEEAFRAALEAAIEFSPEGWVCDGNYSAVTGIVIERADTLVWIQLPWRVTFWRLLTRTLPRVWRGDLLWGVQKESLRQTFLSRNSILLWSITHHRTAARQTRALIRDNPGVHCYELRSSGQVAVFIEASRRLPRE